MMIRATSLLLLAVTACAATVDAQSWSVGDGMVTYQILFANWHNPNGLTYTGQRCDQIGSKCDTRFNGDFEVFGCNATEQRRMSRLTWPGPTEVGQWKRIGQRKYDPNSLRDFAYVNLTGVDCSDFCGVVVRLEVLDVDPLKNDLIDKYIGTLPGCQDLQIGRYENQAAFSLPVAMESISVALPQVTRHHQPSMETIQQHQLHLKVRAWGVSSTSSSRPGVRTSGSRTQYSTNTRSQTARPSYASSNDGYATSTETSSLYGQSRQVGTGFGSSSNTDRYGYPSQSSSTHTRRTYSSNINP